MRIKIDVQLHGERMEVIKSLFSTSVEFNEDIEFSFNKVYSVLRMLWPQKNVVIKFTVI